MISELYATNSERKNRVTGQSGNVLNAMLAAYDPVKNLAVVSLNDRRTQLDFLEIKLPFDWNTAPSGVRIVQSNELLREGTRTLGIDGTAYTLSCFWYWAPVRELWKTQDTVQRVDKQVAVTVPRYSRGSRRENR